MRGLVEGFYSRTGTRWGSTDARITGRDHRRVSLLAEHAGPDPMRVLELGSRVRHHGRRDGDGPATRSRRSS